MDGSALPRCNQESYYGSFQGGSNRARCPADQVVNPTNFATIISNIDLRKATAYEEAVQVQPQHISLKLRISEYIRTVGKKENFWLYLTTFGTQVEVLTDFFFIVLALYLASLATRTGWE